jgi:hypothetical protein
MMSKLVIKFQRNCSHAAAGMILPPRSAPVDL